MLLLLCCDNAYSSWLIVSKKMDLLFPLEGSADVRPTTSSIKKNHSIKREDDSNYFDDLNPNNNSNLEP